MMKMFHSIGAALRKMTPMYLALLVACGVLANAGIKLPSALQWAYEPIEQTTAYAAAIAENAAATRVPDELHVNAGIFYNTYTTSEGAEIEYIIRIPENVTPHMPLVIYLHENGATAPHTLANMGVIKAAEDNQINNCLIVQPLCLTTWNTEEQEELVRELTQHIVTKFYCDEERVVLTGRDSGAVGVWHYTTLHPEYWRKVSPIGAAPADIHPLLDLKVSYYLVYDEYDNAYLKEEMDRVGLTLVESGSTVLHYVLNQKDNKMAFTHAYNDNWFAWVSQ